VSIDGAVKFCEKCGASAAADVPASAPAAVFSQNSSAQAVQDPSLWECFMDCLKNKFATFEGRARRREYWAFYLFNVIICMVPFIGTLIGLVLMIPYLAVTVRRMHDIGKSGYSLLGLMGVWAVSCIGIGFSMFADMLMLIIPCILVAMGAGVMFLIWTVKDSQPGENQYGQNPKGVNN